MHLAEQRELSQQLQANQNLISRIVAQISGGRPGTATPTDAPPASDGPPTPGATGPAPLSRLGSGTHAAPQQPPAQPPHAPFPPPLPRHQPAAPHVAVAAAPPHLILTGHAAPPLDRGFVPLGVSPFSYMSYGQ